MGGGSGGVVNVSLKLVSLKDSSESHEVFPLRLTSPGRFFLPALDLLNRKISIETYRNSDIYVGYFSSARLVLGKYLLLPNSRLVHGGLTYNDYTIVDSEIDRFGFGRGQKLVSGEDALKHDELRIPAADPPSFSGGIWINGQTTPEPFFGHWLHENLSKIFALEDAGVRSGTLWMRSSVPTRFFDWIPFVSNGSWSIQKIDTDAAPVLNDFLVPSAVNYRSRFGGELCVWAEGMWRLRNRARSAADAPVSSDSASNKPVALFVSRNSPWRNLTNIDAVLDVFSEFFDLREARFEGMTPSQQVTAVRGVDIIFGPSGSSMPVVMFADSGTVVCEFFNPKNQGKWAAKVYCDLFGLPHVRVDGQIVSDNLGPTPADANYVVDIVRVKEVAQAIRDHIDRRNVDALRLHDFGGASSDILSPFEVLQRGP